MIQIYILTLVLMVSTTSQNRAMETVVSEYNTKERCENALKVHLERINSLTVGVKEPVRMVGIIVSNCTIK